MNFAKKYLLWIDSLGGLCVGVLVLILSPLLSTIENLPIYAVIAMGVANLIYGSYSLSLVLRIKRSVTSVSILAVANMAWLLVCLCVIGFFWSQISVIGILFIGSEAIYVSGLGWVEWKLRHQLVTV